MAGELPHADQRSVEGDVGGGVVVERCSLEAVKPAAGAAGGAPGHSAEWVRGQIEEEHGELALCAGGVGPGEATLELGGFEPTRREMLAQCAGDALAILI